jgi:hypothetical protein
LSVPPGQVQRPQRAHHRQGHRQQDHEGVDEALELRRQHQEDEQQRQHENQAQRARRVAELAADAVELGRIALRQRAAAVSSMKVSASPSE